jgi:transcriptional regulator with XRE-family HTH domain
MNLTLSEQLVLLRRRRGFSQDELGSKSGISGNTVGRIESGESSPRVDQLEALGKALDADLVVRLDVGE